ncbi:hypothetical protein [Candidatus Cyanaurora vandensis]|uniref:hypothetical protein n=1 Tax=Candidatus Cyanaurora vandensis TaxID=2714958 RepID=UPI002580BD62|nr:hypothetical protein [Candidatus Cyanaurora vandensis]
MTAPAEAQVRAEVQLRAWMGVAQIPSYRQLAQKSGVGQLLIKRLRQQQAHHIPPVKLHALALALGRSPLELLAGFSPLTWGNPGLEQEYQRLQQQLITQAPQLAQEFREQTFKQLETLLTQYPTAHYLAQQSPQWPARQVTPLFLALTQLLKRWEIATIGTVGEAVPYDPQRHQAEGPLVPGETVYIRFIGYCTAQRLLQRARVSRTPPPIP